MMVLANSILSAAMKIGFVPFVFGFDS